MTAVYILYLHLRLLAQELYALANFVQANILGGKSHFRKHFAEPIEAARDKYASSKERTTAAGRQQELSQVHGLLTANHEKTTCGCFSFSLHADLAVKCYQLMPSLILIVCCWWTHALKNAFCHKMATSVFHCCYFAYVYGMSPSDDGEVCAAAEEGGSDGLAHYAD